MTAGYREFLASKAATWRELGREVATADIHPFLHPWQAELVQWAVRTGRAALWEDTGLGKTVQQVEWARLSGERALIVAPLAVCEQTVEEATRIDVPVRYVRDDDHDPAGIRITNYELVERFDPALLDAVVLDEASILKQSDGATRTRLIQHFAGVPRRLSCTATPAPNDPEELTNQAEFLGVMPRVEMLAAYFVHDQSGWRVKGHAWAPMFAWMSTWAVAMRRPSDMGYPDEGYLLPGLRYEQHLLPVNEVPEGQLFATDLGGVSGRSRIRRETLDARVQVAVELVAEEPEQPWLLWCGLNEEATKLTKAIPGAVNVHGSMSPEDKAAALLDFAHGRTRVLVTKTKIAGMGLNFQHCARMAFVGMNDS